ncbi:MAG: peptidoglycan DD-metalloendopeptidase family protein [Clostridiales bacterium]|nr:peptidoglycan DD-metalloendopeptidase family protein [Clostridiales bacterium]
MKKTKTKIVSTVTAAALAASVVLTAIPGRPAADIRTGSHISYDVTLADIAAKKKERDAVRSKYRQASAKVSNLQGQKSSLKGELKKLQGLSDEQYEQYKTIQGQLSAALKAKQDALDVYIESIENLRKQKELFSERLAVMFEVSNKSTLEILLESDNIAGFFTNLQITSLIADADAQAIDQMKIAMDDAQLQSDKALKEADDMQAIADKKQAELYELERRIGRNKEALANVETNLSRWEQEEDTLEALSQSLNGEIARLQNQYAKEHPTNTNTPTPKPETTATTTTAKETTKETEKETTTETAAQSEGGETTAEQTTEATAATTAETTAAQSTNKSGKKLRWPTASHSISSYYGYRTHPVYGDKRFHSGIDINNCGYGSKVSAAAGGTVIVCSVPVPNQNTGGSGYGNYVVIDHGNGLSTLYGHLRAVYVSNGQTVSSGAAIGEVGSTGTSTGPHLHFEVRVNGSTVDPLGYL